MLDGRLTEFIDVCVNNEEGRNKEMKISLFAIAQVVTFRN